ncbi:MAG: hypothetical protein WHX53_08635, partial [Anaerolineae bacterium]
MTAHRPLRFDSLMHIARRLAAVYREATTWQQLAILAMPLAVFALAPTPPAWIAAALVLGGLFYLRLDLGLRLSLAALPFAFAYKRIGADIYSPVEILTVACFLAWAIRLTHDARRLTHDARRLTFDVRR